MKIRLLENVRRVGVSGSRGEVVDVHESVAIYLEQHGQATFVEEAPDESKAPDAPDDSNAADDGGAEAEEVPENEAKPGERKSRRKGKAKE